MSTAVVFHFLNNSPKNSCYMHTYILKSQEVPRTFKKCALLSFLLLLANSSDISNYFKRRKVYTAIIYLINFRYY